MSKKQLIFEQYIKLSIEEKRERYVELSDKDKFEVRTSDYIQPISTGIKINMDKYWARFPERKIELENAKKEINEFLNNCTYYIRDYAKNVSQAKD